MSPRRPKLPHPPLYEVISEAATPSSFQGAPAWRDGAVRVYLSAAPEDTLIADRLVAHFATAVRAGVIDLWHPGRVTGGLSAHAVAGKLDGAELVLLLFSAAYLANEDLYAEAERAFAAVAMGMRVIPVVARPCEWKSTPFACLAPLPQGGGTMSAPGSDLDTACVAVVSGVRAIVEAQRATTSRRAPRPPVFRPTSPCLLDEAPFPWSHARALELRNLLMDAYPDIRDIEFLAKCASISVTAWQRGSPEQAWNHLLELAAGQGKLRSLVERVLADAATTAYHIRIATFTRPAGTTL